MIDKSHSDRNVLFCVAFGLRRLIARPRSRSRSPAAAVAMAAALAIALGACSSSGTLTAGASLAQAGQAAAAQMDQNATLSASSLASLRRAAAFEDGYNGNSGASDTFLATMDKIQAGQAQYAKMLESLAASYAALGALASYDASGNFNSAITSLATDAKTFGATINAPINIPPDASAGVKAVGAAVIGAVQARWVKNASEQIETVLKAVIAVLSDPHTQNKLIIPQREVAMQIDQATEMLFRLRFYSYTPLLDSLGTPLGFKTVAHADALVGKNEKVQKGLANVAVEEGKRQAALAAASYGKSLAALKALVLLHENLQNGAPLDLAALNNLVTQIKTVAASFPRPAKGK